MRTHKHARTHTGYGVIRVSSSVLSQRRLTQGGSTEARVVAVRAFVVHVSVKTPERDSRFASAALSSACIATTKH